MPVQWTILITSVGVLRISHYDVVLFSGCRYGVPAGNADLDAAAIVPRPHRQPLERG